MGVVAYIAMGANLGDRRGNIETAVEKLRHTVGIDVRTVSSLIENSAIGGPVDSPLFLNGTAEIETTLGPRELLVHLLTIEKQIIVRLLHDEPTFADRFLSYMLNRNIRIEADLVDQLFNSSEKRLARTLLLLARYGHGNPTRTLPKLSQETLAEMIGATRSRVNFFMNKFRKLGLIEYNGGLKVNSSLLSIVLQD